MKIELYKPTEIDEILRYPYGKTSRLVKAGKIPHVKLPDGSIRILKSDIMNLLQIKNLENPSRIAR